VTHVDVVVVGGGPAGLEAATAAARSWTKTVLLDEQSSLGGRLRYRVSDVADENNTVALPDSLRTELIAAAAAADVDLRSNTVAWGLFEGNVLGIAGDRLGSRLTADMIVLTTGSTDLALPFAGASLPGIFSGRAIQILLHVHRVRPGRRIAVIGDGSDAAEVASDAELAGCEVLRISPRCEVRAEGAGGVQTIVVDDRRHPIDVVAIAIGRQPDAALALMIGCALGHEATLGGLVPLLDDRFQTDHPGILVAGDAAGVCDVATARAEGRFAGISAAAALGLVSDEKLASARLAYESACGERIVARAGMKPLTLSGGEERGAPRDVNHHAAQYLCRCEEVTQSEVLAAISAGASTMDDIKRRTRAGMGLCQGIYCVPFIIDLIQARIGVSYGHLAPMTARPPVRLLPLDALASAEASPG
jgi:thioredoxin reductase/bacterioferritin-associated ferredoxin